MKTKKIYLDLETGGADPLLHSILSIACRDKDTNKTYSTLIKPQINKCIEQQALDYNGVDVEECYREGVKLRVVLDELILNIFGDANLVYLIGHKIKFDYEFLLNAIKETSQYMYLPPIILIDTKKIAEAKLEDFFKSQEYVRQPMIYEHLFNEKPYERKDKALTDIDMTQRIYEALEEV